MKIRSIRPEFFADPLMAQLSPEARLLYIGLWCYVDDEGRGEWLPKLIEGSIFPLEDVDIHALLEQCVRSGRIVRYSDGNREFFYIPTFSKWQNPNRKYDSKLPDPADCRKVSPRSDHAVRTQRAPHTPHTADAPPVEGGGEGEGGGDVEGASLHSRSRDELSELPMAEFSKVALHTRAIRTLRKSNRWQLYSAVLADWSEELDPEQLAAAVDVFCQLAADGYADTPNLLKAACSKVAIRQHGQTRDLIEDPEWAKEWKL